MNRYLIDFEFASEEFADEVDEKVTDLLDLDDLLGKDRSWADWIDVPPWGGIELITPLSLDELRAKLAQALKHQIRKDDWWWEGYDHRVMVGDIWTTNADGQLAAVLGSFRYQVDFVFYEDMHAELESPDADQHVNDGCLDHDELIRSCEWASNVSTNIWGVCWFTSSLSMKELEEKFNLVLPPYIEVNRLWRAVPRNYVSAK